MSQRVPVGAVLTAVWLEVQAVRTQIQAARILAWTKRETRGHITTIRRRLLHAARQRPRTAQPRGPTDTISARMSFDEAQRLAARLREELGRAIIGQHAVIQEILTA